MRYAVLIEVDVAEVDGEQGLQVLRERIVPAISSMPEFDSGIWLTGGESGVGVSLTVWNTEAAAQAMAERFGVGSSPQANSSVRRCEIREVAATAGVGSAG
jgi:hypothetical protein